MNSIKNFWAPELKSEREARKQEIQKNEQLREDVRELQVKLQNCHQTIYSLQDKMLKQNLESRNENSLDYQNNKNRHKSNQSYASNHSSHTTNSASALIQEEKIIELSHRLINGAQGSIWKVSKI